MPRKTDMDCILCVEMTPEGRSIRWYQGRKPIGVGRAQTQPVKWKTVDLGPYCRPPPHEEPHLPAHQNY